MSSDDDTDRLLEWMCDGCECTAAAPERRLLESMGWRFSTDPGDAEDGVSGLCPRCARLGAGGR